MKNYAAAIDILAAHQTNWYMLVAEIAKANPKAVVTAAAKLSQNPSLEARCKLLMLSNEKIKAIKLWREETGAGLAVAKAAVEAL